MTANIAMKLGRRAAGTWSGPSRKSLKRAAAKAVRRARKLEK